MKNELGNTLLHDAVIRNQEWYVELLCQKGACVDVANNVGQTPLAIAESQVNSVILPILHKYNLMR